MGIRTRNRIRRPLEPAKPYRQVDRDYVAEVQQQAERLRAASDRERELNIDANIAGRQQIEQRMAQLRGEAVQARRLAEHIDNLSREAAAHKRNRTMTDTSITDTTSSRSLKRRQDGRPVAGKNSRNFNPMHPSMELPPEQLIRLLGVESKKTRKYQKSLQTPEQTKSQRAPKQAKAQRAPAQTKPQPAPAQAKSQPAPAQAKSRRAPEQTQSQRTAVQIKPEKTKSNELEPSKPKARRQPNRHVQRTRSAASVFDEKRPALLVPSLIIGVLAGIAVSAYLFWTQPSPATKQETAAPVASDKPRQQSSPGKLVKRNPAAPAKAASTGLPAQAPAQAKTARAGTDGDWQAGIQAEQNRLRKAAEQRHAEQVMRVEVEREAAQLPSPQASDIDPATAAPGRAESALAPAPVSEPAAATFELPPLEQPQPETLHTDQALATPPGEDLSTPEAAAAAEATEAVTDETGMEAATRPGADVGADETAPLPYLQEGIAPVSSETGSAAAIDPLGSSESDSAPSIGHEMAPGANSSIP